MRSRVVFGALLFLLLLSVCGRSTSATYYYTSEYFEERFGEVKPVVKLESGITYYTDSDAFHRRFGALQPHAGKSEKTEPLGPLQTNETENNEGGTETHGEANVTESESRGVPGGERNTSLFLAALLENITLPGKSAKQGNLSPVATIGYSQSNQSKGGNQSNESLVTGMGVVGTRGKSGIGTVAIAGLLIISLAVMVVVVATRRDREGKEWEEGEFLNSEKKEKEGEKKEGKTGEDKEKEQMGEKKAKETRGDNKGEETPIKPFVLKIREEE